MIIAKPIVPEQYWILQEDNKKIGNIEAGPHGYSVKINNSVANFKTLSTLKQRVAINFEDIIAKHSDPEVNQVHGYPTITTPYNGVFDLKHQIPLWTREAKSRSYYAAGWYSVKQGRSWRPVFCPKLILLQRYTFKGPFKTQQLATKL
jgi:hypothetical protein